MLPETLSNHPAAAFQWGVVLGIGLIAALCDLRTGRIPNKLILAAFTAAVIANLLLSGWAGIVDGLLGAAILSIPYILLFLYAGGGAGDTKLMMALGMWLGSQNAIVSLVIIAATGLVMGISVAVFRRQIRAVLINLEHILKHAFAEIVILRNFRGMKLIPNGAETQHNLPYAVAIYLGLCITAGGLLLWNV